MYFHRIEVLNNHEDYTTYSKKWLDSKMIQFIPRVLDNRFYLSVKIFWDPHMEHVLLLAARVPQLEHMRFSSNMSKYGITWMDFCRNSTISWGEISLVSSFTCKPPVIRLSNSIRFLDNNSSSPSIFLVITSPCEYDLKSWVNLPNFSESRLTNLVELESFMMETPNLSVSFWPKSSSTSLAV